MTFKCTYCGSDKKGGLVEFKQNSFCNNCFDERADLFVQKNNVDAFEFFGLKIDVSSNVKSPKKKSSPRH